MTIAQSTTMQAYQLRKGGTPARLAILRMIAADSVNNPNESTRLQPGDWRAARTYTLSDWTSAYMTELSQGMDGGTQVWVTNQGEYFRNERDAHDIIGMRHKGWYSDNDGQETAIGIVASLTHGRFIAGYRWTANDGRVYFPEIFTDEDDAAKMADEHARVFGESAQEDDGRFQSMCLAEIDAQDKLTEVQKAFALRHRPKFGGPDRVRDAIEELREARETLETATSAYNEG